MSTDVVKWVSGELSKLLGTDADDDVARYVLSIGSAHEVEEYLGEILDTSQPKNQEFIGNLLRRCHFTDGIQRNAFESTGNSTTAAHLNGLKSKSANRGKKSKAPSNDSASASKSNQSSLNKPLTGVKSLEAQRSPDGGRSSKTKFVPLFSPEGHDRTVAVIPGRHICECQAAKHALVNNCRGCGRIVCEQEGSGPCCFCHSLVCNKEEQEIIDRNSKKSERLRESLMQRMPADGVDLSDSSGLAKALEHRNRLLEYDKTSAKRTRVIDDESDYFATDSNQWLRSSERSALQRKEAELRDQRYASRRDRKVMIDFAGRRIVEEQATAVDQYEVAAARFENGIISDCEENKEAVYDPLDFDFDLVNPNMKVEAPRFVATVSTKPAQGTVSGGVADLSTMRKLRLQDSELQVMADDGMALSMHQPWATLLVLGIKQHEGRSWYTAHRGILWIAATAKKPESQEVDAIQSFYQNYYGSDARLSFPSIYPTSCLLGCVTVVDCLAHDDYVQQFPGGESDSPYVFVCTNPQELSIKFPIKGKHKIYKLEKHIHQAAKKSLTQSRQTLQSTVS